VEEDDVKAEDLAINARTVKWPWKISVAPFSFFKI